MFRTPLQRLSTSVNTALRPRLAKAHSNLATKTKSLLPRRLVEHPRVSPLFRRMSSAASDAAPVEQYAMSARWMHWISGGGMLACVGLVLAAQQLPSWKKCTPEQKKQKGDLMFYHKSFGLLTAGILFPRLAIAIMNKRPPLPPGNAIEHALAHLSHFSLYALVIFMPVSGVTMGYMGGKGLPFFFTTVTPASGKMGKAANGKLAGQAYKYHKLAGQALEYLIPIHVGAVAFHHLAKGQAILTRINPFA